MILRPILNEDDGLGGLLQDTPEKGNVSSGVEATVLPLIKEVPREVIDQAEAFITFALTTRLDLGLLAAPRPRVRERAPLRERRFIAKHQQAPLHPALRGPSSIRVARAAFCVGVSLGGRPVGFWRGAPWRP